MSNSGNGIPALIKEYKSNPLLPIELPSIINKIKSEDASVLDFKSNYYRDPLLCSYIIDLAWQKARNKENSPFAADHAMSSIGIDGARQFLASMNKEELNGSIEDKLTDEIRFTMSSSLLAGEIARCLLGESPKANLLYWASLTHQFPDLLLWHLKPRQMWRIQYRQLKLPKKLPLFEQAKLGFDLNQWRQAIGEEWHMNSLNQTTYLKQLPFGRKELVHYIKQGYDSNTPSLKEWHLTDSWLIVTANWLARSIMAPWLKNGYQHYFKIAQRAFSTSNKKTNAAIAEAVATVSTHLKGSCLLVPAVSMLQLPGTVVYPGWLNAAPKVPVKRDLKFVKKASELKHTADLLAVQKFVSELKTRPTQFNNVNALLRQVLDLSISKLNFSRAALLVVDWKNKQVSTGLFVTQIEHPKIKPSFSFAENTPLKKFLVEQGFLLFDSEKHQKIWHKLPKQIIEQEVKRFVLFSIKPSDKVEFLIYLDGKGKPPPSIEKLKMTKLLLTTTNKVISYNKSKV